MGSCHCNVGISVCTVYRRPFPCNANYTEDNNSKTNHTDDNTHLPF